jgi:hypothetical protein
VVVRDDADGLIDEEGELVENDTLLPGAHNYLHHDAVGAVTGSMKVDPAAPSQPWGDSGGNNTRPLAVYELESLPMLHGNGGASDDNFVPDEITSTPPSPPEDPPTYVGEPTELDNDEGTITAGSESCCFVGDNPAASQSTTGTDPSTGAQFDGLGGYSDPPLGIQFCGQGDIGYKPGTWLTL